MSALLVAAIVFVILFLSAIAGTFIRERLPAQHLSDDSRHMIEVSVGVIGTLSGIVLGLLVATSFGTFQTQRSTLIGLSAKIALLDRGLAIYGPEAIPARTELKTLTARMLNDMWGSHGEAGNLDPTTAGASRLYEQIQRLDPKTDMQKSVKGQILGVTVDIAQQRWLMYAQQAASLSPVLIGILTFWFAITFLAFGLMSTRNATTITALLLGAFAIAGAVYLIEQLATPFTGAIQISDAPLRAVYGLLGR
jgi:hypothetical protein